MKALGDGSEVQIEPMPVNAPRGLPALEVGPADEMWDRLYAKAYRRLFRWGKVRTRVSVHGRPLVVMSHKAALLADWACWKLVPEAERPQTWPQSETEFAGRVGLTLTSLRSLVNSFRGYDLLKEPLFPAAEKVREVKEVLYDAALRGLRGVGRDLNVKPAEVFLKLEGALQSGQTVNVNHGTQVLVQNGGALSKEELTRQMQEMVHYARLSGLEVDNGSAGTLGGVAGGAGQEPPGAREVDHVEVLPEHGGTGGPEIRGAVHGDVPGAGGEPDGVAGGEGPFGIGPRGDQGHS
jgi:hypothetical protein